MVIRILEITEITGLSLGFGKIPLSASYNNFLMPVFNSLQDPRAPTFVAKEEERKTLRSEEKLNDMRDYTKKKEEQIIKS